ncbi:MAG: alcohol dehydrogenase [Methylibium sp. NZG]|nr:MAG: alcohol dehydrogenase [Methylibium sp. NZG]
MKRWRTRIAAGGLAAAVAAVVVVALNLRDEGDGATAAPAASAPAPSATGGALGGGPPAAASATATQAATIERGRYLALAGSCAGCHTAPGGPAFAGGVGIPTPFGVVFAGNLTPDGATGLGAWTAGNFWRAMHNGRSRDGRLLYPAFPYTHFTQVTRDDSDALFSYLRSLRAVAQANRAHELAFPYRTQAALAVWRALYFRPGVFNPDANRDADWNRGAYLVRGLGHCSACHAPRDRLGGLDDTPELQGGLIPQLKWFAPALGPTDAGPTPADLRTRWFALLKTGQTTHASASGPMAEVVFNSTQHLRDADLRAVARFLAELPPRPAPPQRPIDAPAPVAAQLVAGQAIYKDRCAHCHADDGRGTAGAYPPLAGNATVLMEPPANLVRIVLEGGFEPATAGNPRPHGMPPFAQDLSNADLAALLTHVRTAWGNRAAALQELDVARYR